MVDMQSYLEDPNHICPNLMDTADCRNWTSDCKCKVCRKRVEDEKDGVEMFFLFEDYNHLAPESTYELTTHQYFLCNFEMPAFVFKTRTWGELRPAFLSLLSPHNSGTSANFGQKCSMYETLQSPSSMKA